MRYFAVVVIVFCVLGYFISTSKTNPSAAAAPPAPPDPRDQQIKELSAKVAALEVQKAKPIEHHYQLRESGLRTFRFDPDTGETCIQLTSKEDWKRPDTIRQGCPYADFIALHVDDASPGPYPEAECWLVGNKQACKNLGINLPK